MKKVIETTIANLTEMFVKKMKDQQDLKEKNVETQFIALNKQLAAVLAFIKPPLVERIVCYRLTHVPSIFRAKIKSINPRND